MCSCMCSVFVLWNVGWWWKEERWNPVPDHSLLFSKGTKGAARFNVPIRRTNRYQQYYMSSQHIYCGRVWHLIQDYDVQSSDQKVYISIPPSLEVENLSNENLPSRRGWKPEPAEPEADMLPSEPVRWMCTVFLVIGDGSSKSSLLRTRLQLSEQLPNQWLAIMYEKLPFLKISAKLPWAARQVN